MMKMMAVVLAAVVLVACDRPNDGHTSIVFDPIPAPGVIVAQLAPHSVPVGVVTATPCALVSAFPTGFDLAIVQTLPVNVSLDRLTLHMNDGTNLGSSITFSGQQLTSMFGSTLFVGTRTFVFQPQFVCGLTRPGSIAGEVVLIDARGSARTVSVNAASSH